MNKELICKMYKEGMSMRQIALEFNTNHKLVSRVLKKENIQIRKPSIDHIVPKAKGGTNDLNNLQFLSWFENRCKNDMTQNEWDILKNNINKYLI